MKNTARSLVALGLVAALVALPSCKTIGTVDAGTVGTIVHNFVGFVAQCGTAVGGKIAGDEIAKIETSLTQDPLNFGNVDSAIDGVISDLESKGFLEAQAINFVACVVKDELGMGARDADLGDSLASWRATNARSWIDAHQVTYAPVAPTPPPGAPPAAARAGGR